MDFILSLIGGEAFKWIGGAIAVILAMFGARQSGKRKAENDFMRDAERRERAGRERLADGRASGRTPDERVRANDGDWRGL